MRRLAEVDPDVAKALREEAQRQNRNLELIASENFVSEAVLEAAGSVLTNKYAEGYPGRRYYGGCEVVDVVEDLAIARAKELFGAEHANVQPHSGAQANMAVYFTLLKPGDTVLGPNLSHGGHLTAGSPVNYSGKFYSIVAYGVRKDTERIDLDQVRELAKQHRPKLIIAGGSAFPRAIDFKPFGEIAKEVGAALMADIAHPAGLVAAGLHPSPVGIADFVTSTTHKTLRGPRGGLVLCGATHAQALDKTVMPGVQGGPLMHVIAAKAVAFREALTPAWRAYQQQIVTNAKALADAMQARGFRLVSGGTDTHLLLVDLSSRGITGKDAQEALDRAWITVNKNTIPFETKSPMVTSGIRLGTPAVTTRGMKEPEMAEIARLIDRALSDLGSGSVEAAVRGEVQELTARFPLYEVSVLRPHGGSSRRLAGRTRRRVHSPSSRVPEVPPPLHDLRVHRGRAAARGQAGQPARALRPPEATRLNSKILREAIGRGPGRRRRGRGHRGAPARACGEGDLQPRARRHGHGTSAEARSGCLRPLRLGLSAVQGYQPVHGRGEGAPEGRQDEGAAAASAKARRAEQEIATGPRWAGPAACKGPAGPRRGLFLHLFISFRRMLTACQGRLRRLPRRNDKMWGIARRCSL